MIQNFNSRTGAKKEYSNERQSNSNKSSLQRLRNRFRQQVRANTSNEKTSSGTATQHQMLAKKIRKLRPSRRPGKSHDSFLSFGEVFAVMVMVVMVIVMMLMVVIVVFVIAMVVMMMMMVMIAMGVET